MAAQSADVSTKAAGYGDTRLIRPAWRCGTGG